MKFEKVNEFAKRVNKVSRTIYRFYEKNKDLKEETKKSGKIRMIPIAHQKYWNAEMLFENNKILETKNSKMSRLIHKLHSNENPLANNLWAMDWTYFITVDYKFERNKNYSITMMNKLYESLKEKYGVRTTIRMFFTTEPFQNRNNGQHNHFMLYVDNKKLHELVMLDVEIFFKYDRVDYSKYTIDEGGLFYMLKEGCQGLDWDILGNNLAKEGKKYENKGYKKAV